MNEKVKQFDALPVDVKYRMIEPKIPVMVKMIKDMELNMRKFLIPQGKMKQDSIFVKEFYDHYYVLFPKDRIEKSSS